MRAGKEPFLRVITRHRRRTIAPDTGVARFASPPALSSLPCLPPPEGGVSHCDGRGEMLRVAPSHLATYLGVKTPLAHRRGVYPLADAAGDEGLGIT